MANSQMRPIPSEFINTYVPIPFEEMMKAGAIKQDRYDKGLSALNAVEQQIENLDAAPGSPDEKFKDEQNKIMQDLAIKYTNSNTDLGNNMVIRQLQSDMNKYLDKNRIKGMQENALNYKKYEAQKTKLAEEGKYNPLTDKNDISKYDSSKGVYNYTLSAYTPKEVVLDKYFDHIAEPSYKRTIDDPKDINYGMQFYSTDASDVSKVVSKNLNSWLATKSGQDEVEIRRDELTRSGVDVSKMSDLDIGREIMTEYGQPYIRSALSGTRAAANLRGGRGGSGQGIISTPIVYTAGTKSQVAGTDSEILKSKQEEYQAAKDALSKLPEDNTNLDENTKNIKLDLESTINKYEQTTRVGDEAYRGIIEKDLKKLRDETFNSFRNALDANKYSDQDIYNYMDNLISDDAKSDEPGIFIGALEYFWKGITGGLDIGDGSGKILKDSKRKLPTKITHVGIRGAKAKENLIEGAKAILANAEQAKEAVLSSTFNYSVSDRYAYPVPYNSAGIIKSPIDGNDYYSNMKRVLDNLPSTLESKKVRLISENGVAKNKLLGGKKGADIEVAKEKMTNWQLSGGANIGLNFDDDNGDAIIRLRYSPTKGSTIGQNTSAEYEVRIPSYDSEFMAIAEDYRHSGQIDLYLKFANYSLQAEVAKNIDNKTGHDYTIMDGNGGRNIVKVTLDGTDYKFTINGRPVIKTYKNKQEVKDALQYLQEKAILGSSSE
jgi:hypothetical protein